MFAVCTWREGRQKRYTNSVRDEVGSKRRSGVQRLSWKSRWMDRRQGQTFDLFQNSGTRGERIGGRSLTTRCTDRGSRSDLVPSLHCTPAVHRLPRPQGSLSNPFISDLLAGCCVDGLTVARGPLRESNPRPSEPRRPRVGSWASAQYSATLVNCSTTSATAGVPL